MRLVLCWSLVGNIKNKVRTLVNVIRWIEFFKAQTSWATAVESRKAARPDLRATQGGRMDEDVFNGSIRKFLKTLGVSAQREMEKAVRQALAQGKIKGNEKLSARATVTLGALGLSHEIT